MQAQFLYKLRVFINKIIKSLSQGKNMRLTFVNSRLKMAARSSQTQEMNAYRKEMNPYRKDQKIEKTAKRNEMFRKG